MIVSLQQNNRKKNNQCFRYAQFVIFEFSISNQSICFKNKWMNDWMIDWWFFFTHRSRQPIRQRSEWSLVLLRIFLPKVVPTNRIDQNRHCIHRSFDQQNHQEFFVHCSHTLGYVFGNLQVLIYPYIFEIRQLRWFFFCESEGREFEKKN